LKPRVIPDCIRHRAAEVVLITQTGDAMPPQTEAIAKLQ
jgi:hypothetical protein